MKPILLVLLVANLALYGAVRGWLGLDMQRAVVPEQREPERALQQIEPQRIRVLTPAELRAPIACIELAPLPADDADRLMARIADLGARAGVRPGADAQIFMVHMPPLATRADADKAAADLKSKGVDDLQVLPADAGALRNAISLGVFKSEEAANARLASLKARGVANARINVRAAPNARVVVEVRNVPDDALPKLDDLLKSAGASRTDRVCAAS